MSRREDLGRVLGRDVVHERGIFSWSAGVPLVSNPIIVRDVASNLLLLFALFISVILATQAFFGAAPGVQQVHDAFVLSLRLTALLAVCVLSVSVLLLDNRYVAHYSLGEEGVVCENIRILRRNWKGVPRFATRPFSVPSGYRETRHTTRQVKWDRVHTVQGVRGRHTIVLKSGLFTVARLYCPDVAIYDHVLDLARQHIDGDMPAPKG